jgi:DNA mismatch endonuclease, patch repair protein
MPYDPLSPSQRSERMSRIRSGNSKPELRVRRLVHGLGYRYRLHVPALPGRPDLVFGGRKKVIFVHGCFWHQHGCRIYRMPKSNQVFWLNKLASNVRRDKLNMASLDKAGWTVLIIWECQTKDLTELTREIVEFLGDS